MNVQGEASPKAPSNEVRAGDSVHCEGFAHGGMSSGQVHLGTWRERLPFRCSPTASATAEASELSPLSRREAFKRRTP